MRETGAQRQFWRTGNVGNDGFDFGQQGNKATEPEQDKTNKMILAHCEDADQHGHPPSLIRVSAVHSMGSRGPKVSLIRLGGCPG